MFFSKLSSHSRRHLALSAAVVAWTLGSVGGLVALGHYKSVPGKQTAAPSDWPRGSKVSRREGAATLVMLAHPQCPCTRASLRELNRLANELGPAVTIHVLFVDPLEQAAELEKGESWKLASTIPNATVGIDADGSEARRFGASTSGQVVLYDASGRRVFSGGITSARGHEGDSAGASRIVSLLQTGSAELDSAPVFGCDLGVDPS